MACLHFGIVIISSSLRTEKGAVHIAIEWWYVSVSFFFSYSFDFFVLFCFVVAVEIEKQRRSSPQCQFSLTVQHKDIYARLRRHIAQARATCSVRNVNSLASYLFLFFFFFFLFKTKILTSIAAEAATLPVSHDLYISFFFFTQPFIITFSRVLFYFCFCFCFVWPLKTGPFCFQSSR